MIPNTVGFVGLGNMGMPMAKSLLANGFSVIAYDLNQEAMAEAKAAGALPAASAAEAAARSDPLITMVRDETQTDQVLFGPQGAWDKMGEAKTLIVSSTLRPGYCRDLYEKAKALKFQVIDAPVTDPSGQRHVLGGLTIMVGGDKEAVERNLHVLQAMGKNVILMGPIGNGQVCKLVHQINAFNIGQITRESLNMGVKAGLDLKAMVQALSVGLGSTRGLQSMAEMLKDRQPRKGQSGTRATPAGMAPRDRILALALGQEVGAEMPIAKCISELDADSLYEAYSRALSEYLP